MATDFQSWPALVRAAVRDAGEYLAVLAATIPPEDWDKPALGQWTVRDLVGHATRAFLTIETYLQAGAAGRAEVESPVDYFVQGLAGVDHASVAERGREAGRALGQNPAAEVEAITRRVLLKVEQASDDSIVPTAAGAMRFIDYLQTRVFELTVHSLDLLAALGRRQEPPATALTITLNLAAGLAARRGLAGDLLLAATGRGPLPAGYSIL